jgi:POT family proton-dependent oligopeptide transporter
MSRAASTERLEPGGAIVRGAVDSPGESLGRRFALLILIAGCVVVFRGAYEQIGNTIALWADAGVDRVVTAGWSIPATWFQSLNPLMVFVLTPFYVSRWNRQAAKGREASSAVKMATGAAIVGASYLAIAGVAAWSDAHHAKVSWVWLAGFIILMTSGELFILPVGLGLFGRLAPARLTATTVATWFLAGFFGNLLAGWIGGFWSVTPHAGFFAAVAGVALSAAALLVLLSGRARRLEQA